MSGAPIKSPWEITNRAVPGIPGANDLILYAPEPGVPFVTQCKSTTPAGIIAGGGALAGGVLSRQVDIPHAQILTLPTASVEVIPTPTTKQHVVFWCIAWCNPLVADYTNVDPACAAASSNTTFFGGTLFQSVITGGVGRLIMGITGESAPAVVIGPFQEWRFRVTNGAAGNFTGGNVANVLHVAVFYFDVTP